MSYLRTAILTLMSLILVIVTFMLVSFGTDDEIASLTNLYLEGNYQKTKVSLKHLEKNLPPAQAALFYAYIAKEEKKTVRMKKELAKAHQESGWEQISDELFAFELLEAFEQHDEKSLKDLLKTITSNHPWHAFFTNISRSWKTKNITYLPITSPPPILSKWNGKLVRQYFNPSWINDFNLELKISKGDYLGGRRDLSDNPPSPSKEYLLGLTYLQEALAKPADLAQPYLEQAFCSFEMSSLYHPHQHVERKKVVKKLLEHAYRINPNHSEEREQIALWLEKLEAFNEAKKLRTSKNIQ